MSKHPRHAHILEMLVGLGLIALLLSVHLMETWPVQALWVAVAGAVLWIVGRGGAILMEV